MANVFVSRKIPDSGISLLKGKHDVAVSKLDGVLPKKDLIKNVKGKDALLCLLTDKVDEEVMDASPKLKIISNYAVGFDNIDVAAATKRKIIVTNTPGVLTETVAEHAFALMLGIARRIVESDAYTRKGKYKAWAPMLLLGSDLNGKTLGILGLGRIGSAVAQRARGFGMNIIYYDAMRNEQFEKEFGAQFVSTDQLFRLSDFISVHVPLLPATRHLVGYRQLLMMKKTAYLINTSRGPIIDEKALVKALKQKVIAGAALDVYENEPRLAAGLARLENVILTPHTASATIETRSKMSVLAAQSIIDYFDGKTPVNVVNRESLQK